MEEMESINALENINITEVCRACFETCEQYKILFDEAETTDKRTLGDVFFDVVKIDITTDAETKPGRLCLTCCNDLTSAYNFIQKSQKNNERLVQYLNNASSFKKHDCLHEFPIEDPNDQSVSDFLQIKVEDETISEYKDTMTVEFKNSPANSNDSDGSDYHPTSNKKMKIENLQCAYCKQVVESQDCEDHMRTMHPEECVQKKETEEEESECNVLECEDCDFCSNSKLEMEQHQKAEHKTRSKIRSWGQKESKTRNSNWQYTLPKEPAILPTPTAEITSFGDVGSSHSNTYHQDQTNFSPGEKFIIDQLRKLSSKLFGAVDIDMNSTRISSKILPQGKLIRNEDDLKQFEKRPDEWRQLLRLELLEHIGKRHSTEIRYTSLELCDLLIHRDFWHHCSWAGGTKDEAKPKFAFYLHCVFLNFFKAIVQEATGGSYSDKELASFFQIRMKNRNNIRSNIRRTLSKHKKQRKIISVNILDDDKTLRKIKDDKDLGNQSLGPSKNLDTQQTIPNILSGRRLIRNENDLNQFEEQSDEWKKRLRLELLEKIGKRYPTEVRSECLKLCNLLISYDFWQHTSWKGGTKDEAKPKFALQIHLEFLHFFKMLVRDITEASFSDKQLAIFFQGRMKNRNQYPRKLRRPPSRQKNPKKIIFEKVDEDDISFPKNENDMELEERSMESSNNVDIKQEISCILTKRKLIRNENDLKHFKERDTKWKILLRLELLKEIGKRDPSKVRSTSLELCDLLISYDFWQHCSWAGGTKDQAKPKFALQKHSAFLNFFKTIIEETTDACYSDKDLAIFFQSRMKNRNQIHPKRKRLETAPEDEIIFAEKKDYIVLEDQLIKAAKNVNTEQITSNIFTEGKLIRNEDDLEHFEEQADEWIQFLRRKTLDRIGKRQPNEVRTTSLELCDLLICHDFWQYCSWAGGTKDQAKPKFALREHRVFLNFFKVIVEEATNTSYSEKELAIFFQGRLKNRNYVPCTIRRPASRHRNFKEIALESPSEDEKTFAENKDDLNFEEKAEEITFGL